MNIFKNTDSLSLTATLDKGTIDLVLTDPPYIISHETGFKSVKNGVQRFAVETEFGDWDKPENFSLGALEDSIKEYYRVLRAGGTAIIFKSISYFFIQNQKQTCATGNPSRFHPIRIIPP